MVLERQIPPPGPETEEQECLTAETQIPTFELPEALKHGMLKSGPVCCPDYHGAKQTTEDSGKQFPHESFLRLFWMSSHLANGHTA